MYLLCNKKYFFPLPPGGFEPLTFRVGGWIQNTDF
jgi:hypothetical protein